MSKRFIFDIETNGLLDELTKLHCLVLKDIDTGEVISCANTDGYPLNIDGSYRTIEVGLQLLETAALILGHNVIKFDIPAIQKVYCKWKPQGVIRDTLTLSRLVYPSDVLRDIDFRRVDRDKADPTRAQFPKQMIGRYSLAAWGHRLMEYKGDYDSGWDHWSPTMQHYCEQDVEVTFKLWNKLLSKNFSEQSIELEHKVQTIIFRQEQYGFLFDEQAAKVLYADLIKKQSELETKLQEAFPPRERYAGTLIPKRDNKARGYVAGVPVVKTKLTMFNPGSRDHIAEWLMEMRGWKPKEYTAGGKPTVDEKVLSKLPYPEAKLMFEYLTLGKRIGQLGEGKEAWLKAVGSDGRIHGSITTNGAVTGRMTHSKPNIAQAPANRSLYGEAMRSLFICPKGKKLVGADADALELRDLAGYMARFDSGSYIDTVLKGDKSKGTDIHSVNCRALGMDPKGLYKVEGKELPGRDIAKTWFYALFKFEALGSNPYRKLCELREHPTVKTRAILSQAL